MQNQYIFQRTICKHGNTFALATKTSLNMWLFKSESKSLAWNLNSANSSLASKYIKLIFHTSAHKFPRTQTCPTVPGALLSLTSMGHKEQECKETFPSQHLHLPNKLIFQVVKLKRKKKHNKNAQANNSSWKRQRWEPCLTLPLSVCLHRWQLLPPPIPTLTRGKGGCIYFGY